MQSLVVGKGRRLKRRNPLRQYPGKYFKRRIAWQKKNTGERESPAEHSRYRVAVVWGWITKARHHKVGKGRTRNKTRKWEGGEGGGL